MTKDQDGFALILVLLVVGALSALILDMNYTTRVNFRLAENFRDETQAVFLALGSVEAAKALLLEDGDLNYDAREGEDDAIWATPNEHMEAGGSIKIKFTILDEGGKFWLPDFFDPQAPPSQVHQAILDDLEYAMDLDEQVFDSIQDWIDQDDTPLQYGAENDDYYLNLDPPYKAPNGPLLDLSELLLVKGVDDALFLGKNSGFAFGLNDMFTLYKNHGGGINVNTADPKVLTALVDSQFAVDVANAIPIEDKTAIPGYSSPSLKNKSMLDVRSSYFSVHVWIQVHNVTKRFQSILQRDQQSGKLTVHVESWQEL
ncbi:MAG: type II secretion system minor pseudopilin GspK [bacterium]|nr:type II secretion system minor pseudopilin GspK [bacterium]